MEILMRSILAVLCCAASVSLGASPAITSQGASYYDGERPPNKYRADKGYQIILDRRFLNEIAKDPRPGNRSLSLAKAEFLYLVFDGDRQAIDIAIYIIANSNPDRVKVDDHDGLRPIVWLISYQRLFIDVLQTKPIPLRKKVLRYFDVNPKDFKGVEGYEWSRKEILKSK